MAAPRGAMRHVTPTNSPARAPSPATGAPGGGLACLVGWVRPTLPRRPAHDPRSGTRNHASSGSRPSRQGRSRTTRNSTRSSQDRCPAVPRSPYRHHPTDAGRDGCNRADGRTPHGWTPGPWTAGRVGWTPSSGHSLAMDSRQPSWHPNHGDEDPPAGMLSRSSAGQTSRGPIRNQDSSAGEGPAGSWPPPHQTGVGDPPPSGRRLAALLSCVGVGGYEEKAMALRKLRCAGQAGKGVRMGGSEALRSMVRSVCAGRYRYRG
jgi:hypothetical protein